MDKSKKLLEKNGIQAIRDWNLKKSLGEIRILDNKGKCED